MQCGRGHSVYQRRSTIQHMNGRVRCWAIWFGCLTCLRSWIIFNSCETKKVLEWENERVGGYQGEMMRGWEGEGTRGYQMIGWEDKRVKVRMRGWERERVREWEDARVVRRKRWRDDRGSEDDRVRGWEGESIRMRGGYLGWKADEMTGWGKLGQRIVMIPSQNPDPYLSHIWQANREISSRRNTSGRRGRSIDR